MTDLTVDSTARAQAAAVRSGEISATELLELHLDRIEERNPELNAIVSLDAERARAAAAVADQAQASGEALGPLHGLPFAVKDTHALAGWRTTYGSPIFADSVADHDDLLVERIRAAGAVFVGKTNAPEFAAGSHTFNTVFGVTRNPRDPSRSAGGSSGGAACALASGMVPLAEGSDMGGSLRNPASFCGVVGMRPSLGRVPAWPAANQWETTSTVVACDPERVFSWAVGDPAEPSAVWRFGLEPRDGGTALSQWMRMGPGRSGLSFAIDAMPEKEQKIVFVRLREFERGMTATLEHIRQWAEA